MSTKWEIPQPIAAVDVPVDNQTLITVRRHGNADGPRLILSHGNGLAIDLYYPFWSTLEEDFDLVIFDLRNHGWNKVSEIADHHIPSMVRDHELILEAVDGHFGPKPKVGVYHSVSALVSLLAPGQGDDYAGLVLYDPPLCKPGRNYQEFEAAATRNATMARRRAEKIASREQFIEVLSVVPLFQRTVPGVFDLIADTTLRGREGSDELTLRCPREYEARIMQYAGAYAVAVNLSAVSCPTKVIGADPTVPYSYLPSLELHDIMSANYDFLPDATHLLQLEQPRECAQLMREFLVGIGIT